MATIYEVSKLAGVSLATVSRVMNKTARVNESTRIKVLDAIKKLNYRPNSMAQSLASNCTNTVGVLVSELEGSFFGKMMSGIEGRLRKEGKHVVITTGLNDESNEKEGIEFLKSKNCDALILQVEAVNDDYLINLCKESTPVFLMGRLVRGISERCIYLNNELGGYLATKAVINNGHKDIAYISGQQFKADSIERLNGHKRALTEYNIPFNNQMLFEGDFREACGREGLKRLIDVGLPFTALVCGNDEMALGAMTYAREMGYLLPEKLSIVGFDNIVFSNHLFPKLTTVNNPIFEMGEMAAQLVLKEVYQQNKLSISNSFDPSIIIRDSISVI